MGLPRHLPGHGLRVLKPGKVQTPQGHPPVEGVGVGVLETRGEGLKEVPPPSRLHPGDALPLNEEA
ncbi:hypothetical protein AV541_08050 [Thermus parvatiensis]|uniref:Uncharacterized protein n=1 Tax=Thermus parvatiensis TaxID=456163 RepID=A0A0X8D9X7_9DEIN|nr:hypothetical protein AV541_08050 [Thermus parvatiensis]